MEFDWFDHLDHASFPTAVYPRLSPVSTGTHEKYQAISQGEKTRLALTSGLSWRANPHSPIVSRLDATVQGRERQTATDVQLKTFIDTSLSRSVDCVPASVLRSSTQILCNGVPSNVKSLRSRDTNVPVRAAI